MVEILIHVLAIDAKLAGRGRGSSRRIPPARRSQFSMGQQVAAELFAKLPRKDKFPRHHGASRHSSSGLRINLSDNAYGMQCIHLRKRHFSSPMKGEPRCAASHKDSVLPVVWIEHI